MSEVFKKLNGINVNEHTEKKNGLTYLSWAWAWAEVKKQYPDATYKIRYFDGKPYLEDDIGYMVMTEMTIDGITHEMWLPVMDGANKAMKAYPYYYKVKNRNFQYAKLNEEDGKYYDKYGNEQTEYIEKEVEAATMFDVNTAIMRCLTKNIAMFGLGLYIYAGEDLPEEVKVGAQRIPEVKVKALLSRCDSEGVDPAKICKLYKVSSIADLTENQFLNIHTHWDKVKAAK